jgi:hypothetical protein
VITVMSGRWLPPALGWFETRTSPGLKSSATGTYILTGLSIEVGHATRAVLDAVLYVSKIVHTVLRIAVVWIQVGAKKNVI